MYIFIGESGVCGDTLTVDEDDRLFDRALVVKLRVEEVLVDERPEVGALIPADVKMVDVHLTQVPHHLHLVDH